MKKEYIKPDYYRILGVSPLASKREIKQAFRRKALRHHPDHNPSSQAHEGEGKDMFLLISEAHEILSNDARRSRYDRERRAGGTSFSGTGTGTGTDSARGRTSRAGGSRGGAASDDPWSMRSIWSAYRHRTASSGPFKEWRTGPDPRAVRAAALWGGLLGLALGATFGQLFLGVAGMVWAAALLGGCSGLAGGILGSALGAAFHAFGLNAGYSAGAVLGILGAVFAAGLLVLFVDPYPQVVLNGIINWGEIDAAGAFLYSLFPASALSGAAAGGFFSRRAYAS